MPYSLMLKFAEDYGLSETIFSTSVKEGKAGYTDEDFFRSVFDERVEHVSDYAMIFISNLDYAGECAVFLCYSEYDALVACDILRGRVDLIKSISAGIDTSYTEDARIFKSGRYAVMCVLPDNERAERIWRKIL